MRDNKSDFIPLLMYLIASFVLPFVSLLYYIKYSSIVSLIALIINAVAFVVILVCFIIYQFNLKKGDKK